MHVLMIHGLGRTPLSMLGLARALRRAGYVPRHFGYVAFAESYAGIVTRLQARLREVGTKRPYAVVAHSLGGLLARDALRDPDVPVPVRIVMLGTPNQRSRMAEWAVGFGPWRWVVGEAGRNLANRAYFESLQPLTVPYTLVAGTRGLHWRWLPLSDWVNDGLVALEEMRVQPGDTIVMLPVGHTFMMNDRGVQRAVAQTLEPAADGTR